MSDRVTTNKFRVAFPKVFEPNMENDKYSICMIFDSENDIANIKELIKAKVDEVYGDKVPKNLKMPYKDDSNYDADDYPDFQGKFMVNAATKFKPNVVDGAVQPILDQEEFYGGCYARASVTAYQWTYNKSQGIGLNFHNVQKLADGERFGGGGVKASDEFEAVESSAEASGFDI